MILYCILYILYILILHVAFVSYVFLHVAELLLLFQSASPLLFGYAALCEECLLLRTVYCSTSERGEVYVKWHAENGKRREIIGAFDWAAQNKREEEAEEGGVSGCPKAVPAAEEQREHGNNTRAVGTELYI